MSGKKRVLVVGGGVSGLAAAHRLQELAAERDLPLTISLREASDRVGGTVSTRREDGFVLEEGPDSILTEKPWALDLARRLGIEDRVVGTLPDYRRAFVACRGKLQPTPEGFYLLAPSSLLPFATTPIFSSAAAAPTPPPAMNRGRTRDRITPSATVALTRNTTCFMIASSHS